MNDLSVEEFLQSCKNGSPSEKACDNFILDKWESHEKRRMKQDQDLIKELDKLPKGSLQLQRMISLDTYTKSH